MGELLRKGYARKLERNVNNGGLWYLPHQRVRHASKLGKVRILFDCSANFGGACLNNKLLSGPGLTNQLAGILLELRSEEVDFMGDIEAMFYQAQVSDNQRGFLRYLLRENDNLERDLVDDEMCMQMFGGTSFPGGCNYTLRKTAVDNAPDLKVGVAETLIGNFYVDNLFNSVEFKDSAIQLIQDVMKIYQRDGFNLPKFTSNRKGVLKSVADHRKDSVKNKDLDGKLPKERALGICWDFERDTFKFQIDLKEKPMTQREMLSNVSSIYDPLGFVAPFILKSKIKLQLLYQDEIGWDERVHDSFISEWIIWQKSLKNSRGSQNQQMFQTKWIWKNKGILVASFSRCVGRKI